MASFKVTLTLQTLLLRIIYMSIHSITFNLTTEQVNNLNSALNEHHEANTDAISSDGLFSNNEMSNLKKQCEALDILISSIKNIVSEPTYAK